jgi:hypothetical protein
MSMHYIICLTHTQKNEPFITLWRPDNAGYCWSKDWAGQYESPKEGYHDSADNLPILIEDAEKLFLTVNVEGAEHKRMPNCKAVWDALGVRMGRHNLEKQKK